MGPPRSPFHLQESRAKMATILIFDEFIINEHWEQDEYKALNEFCVANNYTFEVLAISFFTKQVAVKLVGI